MAAGISGFLVLGISLLMAQPAWTADQPSAEIAARPGIFLGAERLTELRQKAQEKTPQWRRLIVWAQQPERDRALSQDGPGLALAGLVLNRQQPGLAKDLLNKAKDCALKAAKTAKFEDLALADARVREVALTLEWAWDAFSEGQRRQLGRWLISQAESYRSQGRGCFDSNAVRALRLGGLASLAARGIHSKSGPLLREALDVRFGAELLPCLLNAGNGGGWFEGQGSGAAAGLALLEFAAAVKTTTGQDLLASAPWFKDRLNYLMFSLLPGLSWSRQGLFIRPCPGGDQVVPLAAAGDLFRLQMLLLARMQPEQPAAGWARSMLLGGMGLRVLAAHRLVYEFLWTDLSAPQTALTNAPLTWSAPVQGKAFSRSDWSARATWLGFTCGPHFARAQHLDAASLMLFGRGFIQPPGGAYDGSDTDHALNYAVRSVAHNTLVIRDPGEYSWYDMGLGPKARGTYANDGGQRAWASFKKSGKVDKQAPWTSSGWETGPAPFSKLGPIYQAAFLEAVENRPRFAYFRGNATKSYQGSTNKAARVVRHVLHLRSGGPQDADAVEAVVVVDDVEVNREEAQVRFVSHFSAKPVLPPDLEELGPGRMEGMAQKVRIETGSARLDLICLVPDQAKMLVFGGQGQADSWAGGKNHPPRKPGVNRAPWRVEFGRSNGLGRKRPLAHVMFPADRGAADPPALQKLEGLDPGAVGLVIPDPRRPRVIVVNLGEPSPQKAVSYDRLPGHSRHLVAGLVPGQSYAVRVTQSQVTIKPGSGLKASDAGLLAFQVA
ncbi:MAG: hypothetical protein PVG60_09850, partial [Desulfarculaceae bacterium]